MTLSVNTPKMTLLGTNRIVNRVISEVGGTIATNGIQELNHEESGGVSQFGYVRACLVATAYNSVRAMQGFDYSYEAFFKAVEQETEHFLSRKA